MNTKERKFEDAKDMRIEFMTDRARIYTLTYEDKSEESFIVTPQDIREFLAGMYDKYKARGDVFGPEEYEKRRKDYILSIGGTEDDV